MASRADSKTNRQLNRGLFGFFLYVLCVYLGDFVCFFLFRLCSLLGKDQSFLCEMLLGYVLI